MSTQGPPPSFLDGPSESPDSQEPENQVPEGLLMARYNMSILLSADFLKDLEKLCDKIGADRQQFDQLVFSRGIQTIKEEMNQFCDEDLQAEIAMIGRLGMLARKRNSEEW